MKCKANGKPTGVVTRLRRKLPVILITGVVVAGLIGVVWNAVTPSSRNVSAEVAVPSLSAIAATGKTLFDANCAQGHGANAAGTGKGPLWSTTYTTLAITRIRRSFGRQGKVSGVITGLTAICLRSPG